MQAQLSRMTKNQIKLFQSLSRQKYRKEHNSYLVEGDKNAKEWLSAGCAIPYIATSARWYEENKELIMRHKNAEVLIAEPFELEKISALQHAQEVVLIAEKAPRESLSALPATGWMLFLERIQDPGNMGTILRTADWFGIENIICSPDCVEVYNPKVVQSTMGSLLRVKIWEADTEELLQQKQVPIYAASLSGEPMEYYNKRNMPPGIIAFGNESQGLSDTILSRADFPITIPGTGRAESLNVAVACGIICYALASRKQHFDQ